MKYILDFDRTLFDTDKMIVQFQTAGFDMQNLLPKMLDGHPSKEYLYDDVLPFLLNKQPADIFILTALGNIYGEKILEYQKAKLEQEPIQSLINQVTYVVEDKGQPAADIMKQFPPHEPVVFVDDLLKNCLSVKAVVPHAQCFWLVRTQAPEGEVLVPEGITLVRTLVEVDGLVVAAAT